MTGGHVALLVVAVAAGALLPAPLPPLAAGAAVVLALGARRPVLFCLAASLVASGCSYRAWSGLTAPASGAVTAAAVLAGDPKPVPGGGVRVDLRIDGRRLEATAFGAAAAELRSRLAGEHVHVSGRIRRLPPYRREMFAARHIAARIDVAAARFHSPGSIPDRVANSVRRLLADGSKRLSLDERSLLAGMVLGDDREQPEPTADAFRQAGLSHLLAVSGQNVAFVLLLARPLLVRLSIASRFFVGLAVLALFGVVTRWEPSVLRAVAMAAAASFAAASGRPASTGRILGITVAGVLIVDPLLVHSLAFRLSVAACTGIAALAGPLERWLRGPSWLTLPLAVTGAAQVGVAPVLIPVFGDVPLVALPANVLAGPAAGPLMAWGLVAGPAAGLLGEPWATLLHTPTRVLVGWIAAVARISAALPLGGVRGPHAVTLAAAAGSVAVVRLRLRRRPVSAAGASTKAGAGDR